MRGNSRGIAMEHHFGTDRNFAIFTTYYNDLNDLRSESIQALGTFQTSTIPFASLLIPAIAIRSSVAAIALAFASDLVSSVQVAVNSRLSSGPL